MKYRKILPILLAGILLLTGCNNTEKPQGTEQGSSGTTVDFSQAEGDLFTDRDLNADYEESSSTHILFNGSDISCDSDAVSISGSTITITDEGTYILSGTLADGQIIVEAEDSDKPQIVLAGVTIQSSQSAPLCILESDKVVVTLAEGTTNTLSNGGTFTAMDDENVDGVVYSKADLSFNGTGKLIISSLAGHGIVGKDDLVFTGGSYEITSSGHGLDANDSLRVKDAAFTITTGKDGAHIENNDDTSLGFIFVSNGTFSITSEGDGLSSSAYVQILDGAFSILAGGGYENGEQHSSENWGGFGGGMGGPGGGRPGGGGRSNGTSGESTGTTGDSSTTDDGSTSMKGIKAESGLLISGGTFAIDSADDSIHSNSSAFINGGTFSIASGDDAFHAEETLEVTAGTVSVSNSYEGLEALNIMVSGGDISLQSTDDGFNAAGGTDSSGSTGGRDGMMGGGMGSGNSNGSISISGGNIFMYAQGDGLDANGTISITGGYTVVTGPTQGDTAILDYDTSATISGGTFIGVGSTMMAQTFSDGGQGTMAVQASGNGGTEIRIEDANGKEIVSFTPETPFQCVIISTPDIVQNDPYTIYVGSASGTFEAQ